MEKQVQGEIEMRDQTLIVAVSIGLVVLVAAPAVGMATMGATQAGEEPEPSVNGTAPGERLAGVVGVQAEEIEAGVEHNAFNIRFAQADSPDDKATEVGDRISDIEQRLSALEQRREELKEQRENGVIREGRYRAEIATVAAEIGSLKKLNNQSERAAGQLPAELLEERGINVTAIQALQQRANELSGGEVSDIARDIAGGPPDDVGPPVNRTGPPEDAGPPGHETGPHEDAGPPGNETGPPDDAGPPDNETGPGDDPPDDDPPGDDPPGDGPRNVA